MKSELLVLSIIAGSARHMTAMVACASLMISTTALAAPPSTKLLPVTKMLEAEDIPFQPLGDNGKALQLLFKTSIYRDYADDHELLIYLTTSIYAGQQWLDLLSASVYSFEHCAHPAAARSVLLGAELRLHTMSSFQLDDSDGTVAVHLRIPLLAENSDSTLLRSALEQMVDDVDAIDGVMRRAVASGMVVWPEADKGPAAPTHTLNVKDAEDSAATVKWAPWESGDAYASTLVGASDFLRKFLRWDQDGREAFGRQLTNGHNHALGRTIYQRWLKGADGVGNHPPAGAIRVWAAEGTEVTTSFTVDNLTRTPGSITKVVDASGIIDLFPQAAWDIPGLVKLEQPTDVTLHMHVEVDGAKDDVDLSLRIQPVTMADKSLPAGFPIALYANELHPWVKDIIAEAGRLRIVDSLGCTEDTSDMDTVRQVFAVWSAFRARDLGYISISRGTDEDRSQRMRQFHESISDSGANCADATAAFAGVLQALGFDVHVAVMTGHALIAVHYQGTGEDHCWLFLETTLLGVDAVEPQESSVHPIASSIPERWRGAEWNVYKAALETGENRVDAALDAGDLSIISLKKLREAGIKPIPATLAAIGLIPPVPDRVPIDARRADTDAKLQAKRAAFETWLDTLPNRQPTPYTTVQEIEADMNRFPEDPTAIGRLLRCVDGDTSEARSLRAQAVIEDAIIPFRRDAAERFGGPSPFAGASLVLPDKIARIEFQSVDGDRFLAKIYDESNDVVRHYGVHKVPSGFCIDGNYLVKHQSARMEMCLTLNMMLDVATFNDPAGLEKVVAQVRGEIADGKLADHGEAIDRFAALLMEICGRRGDGNASN